MSQSCDRPSTNRVESWKTNSSPFKTPSVIVSVIRSGSIGLLLSDPRRAWENNRRASGDATKPGIGRNDANGIPKQARSLPVKVIFTLGLPAKPYQQFVRTRRAGTRFKPGRWRAMPLLAPRYSRGSHDRALNPRWKEH